jgi:16S rRNA G966 N2-methylase RsmD
MTEKAKLMPAEALQYLRRTVDRFGLIFLDPPYGGDLLDQALPIAAERLAPGGLLICEAGARKSLPERHGDVALRKEYRHGKTKICVYQRENIE